MVEPLLAAMKLARKAFSVGSLAGKGSRTWEWQNWAYLPTILSLDFTEAFSLKAVEIANKIFVTCGSREVGPVKKFKIMG